MDECDPTVWCTELNPNVTVDAVDVATLSATFLAAILQQLKGTHTYNNK